MTWQLAETAPKTGGKHEGWGPSIMAYDGEEIAIVCWIPPDYMHPSGQWALTNCCDGDWMEITHWMPLPPTPVTGEDK